jgi:hypothetical protein
MSFQNKTFNCLKELLDFRSTCQRRHFTKMTLKQQSFRKAVIANFVAYGWG